MIITSTSPLPDITIPTSKSFANRALILAALKKEDVELFNLPKAQDVLDMLDVFQDLELISNWGEHVHVLKSFPENEVLFGEYKELYLGEGGTTIRFLLPFLALGKQKYLIKVHPRFKQRPYKDLLVLLEHLGARVEHLSADDELCFIQGPIKLKQVEIDCSQTSQNLSSFLLLKLAYQFDLVIKNLSSSLTYVKMTEELVNAFHKQSHYTIPVDMSSASYFIALGCIHQSLTIKNIKNIDSLQADSKIFEILDLLGVDYSFSSLGLKIKKIEKPKSFEVDIRNCLDLAPTLAFIASFCSGTSTLKNIMNLKHKESNRILAIIEVLEKFGVVAKVQDEDLIIFETNVFKKIAEITVPEDHRIVMMAALFLKTFDGGSVQPEAAINKSFPEFFELLG
tara:strand:- start:28 stop:1215 length:1188 start_codon:yes stop_codon:yes gene_type:complete